MGEFALTSASSGAKALNAVGKKWVWLVGAAISSVFLLVMVAPAALITLWSERASHRKYAGQIREACDERLVPASAWVRTFRATHGRLPSDDEMRVYSEALFTGSYVAIHRDRPCWIDEWGVQGEDFVVSSSVPEWNLYYCSWNQQLIKSWSD